MDPSSFKELLNRYYTKTCTEQEITVLAQLVKQPEYDAMLNEWLATIDLEEGDELLLPEQTAASILSSIFIATENPSPLPVHRVHFLKTTWFRYAAILLLIAGAATFLYLGNKPEKDIVTITPYKQPDIQPGGNKAVLTLANGSTIVLETDSVGALASQGNTKIVQLNTGEVAYQAGSADDDALSNTISTPKGGQYQILLSDGSRVWLNAASSITFPTAFKKERRVTITGEAYLEVAKNKEKPFIVDARGTVVNVLGTGFNVNAYSDEAAVKTVLVEGSVQVIKDNNVLILKPGQQCSAAGDGQLAAVNADIEQVLAWKNGMFHFNHTNLADAMRQVARWYDVDVLYEKGVPDIKLMGEIKRDLTLSQILDGLGELGVKFRINGKQLIVHNDLTGK